MNIRRITIEHGLYLLVLALALWVRLLSLGATPLSDAEANWALQALQVAHVETTSGQVVTGLALSPQPAYLFLTGLTFAIFGSANALARIWPALAGGFLVLLPAFFRRDLGRLAALILAFGLALDPGLATVSREAGGPMMALAFGLLALGWWHARRWALAGIFAGMALLSGPAVLMGTLALALAWGVTRLVEKLPSRQSWVWDSPAGSALDTSGRARRLTLFTAGTAILLAGTFFFLTPQGLSAWFGTLPAYLQGWLVPSGMPALRLVAALAIYQPFALLFGLLGAGRAIVTQEDLDPQADGFRLSRNGSLFLTLWAAIALALALFYPARQVADLVWVMVPLWSLAALELVRYLPDAEWNLVSLGQAILVLILLALFWLLLDGLSAGQAAPGLKLGILAGILALGALATVLVSLGWSWEAGRKGLVWGLSAASAIYLVSALWGAAQLRLNQPQELWSSPPATGQEELFMKTLEYLSMWKTGFPQSIDAVVVVDSPSLRWALRDFANARFVSELSGDDQPSIVITRKDQEAPALAAAYRGQDFAWWLRPAWSGALPPDVIRWLTYREATLQEDQVILWARGDLFPGGTKAPQIPAQP